MSDAGKGQTSEKLSAVELKQHLYHKFRERGILDELRAQLRNRLVTELHQGAVIPHKKREKTIAKSENQPLLLQITNWLIAEHLRKYGFDYTLSVFMTDCPTLNSAEELFSLSDILSLLRIDPKSESYKVLNKNYRGDQGILLLLLQMLGLGITDGTKWQEDQGIQTELMQMSVTYNFKEKLQQVDDLYLLKRGALKIELEGSVEAYLLKYQRNLEEQLRKQSKAELESYKERELQQVMMTEKENYRTKLEEIRKDLEQEYRQKFETLINRERKAMEEYEKLKNALEKETFNQRQEVLAQLDTTRAQELNYKRKAEMLQQECELEKERYKSLSEKIKIREDALSQKEASLDSRVQQLASQQRFQEQREHLEKMAELQKKELKLDELTKHLEEEKKKCEEKQREAENVFINLQEKELEMKNLKISHSSLLQQVALLKENLRNFEEYKNSKSEAELLRKEMKALQEKLIFTEQELMKANNQLWELKEHANKPNPQVVQLQQTLENQKMGRELDKAVWQEQRNRMEIQLNSALDRNKALNMKIEQQASLMDHMQHIIQDLRDQLHQAYSTLNNAAVKSHQKNEGYLPEKNSSLTERNHHLDYDTYFDTSLNMSRLPPELELHNLKLSPVSDKVLDDSIVYKNIEFLEESRRRMKALEEEAKKLEKRYMDFQQQMKRPSPLHPFLHFETGFEKHSDVFSDKPLTKELESHFYRHLNTEDLTVNNKTPSYSGRHYEKMSNSDLFNSLKKNYCIVSTGDTFDWSFSQKHFTPKPYKYSHDFEKGRDLILEKSDPLHSTLQEETLETTLKPVAEAEASYQNKSQINDQRTFDLVINPMTDHKRISESYYESEIVKQDEKNNEELNKDQRALSMSSVASENIISRSYEGFGKPKNENAEMRNDSLVAQSTFDPGLIIPQMTARHYPENLVSNPLENLSDARSSVDPDSFWKISKIESDGDDQIEPRNAAESSSKSIHPTTTTNIHLVSSSNLSKVNLDSGSESGDDLHCLSSKVESKSNTTVTHQKPVVNLDLAWKTKSQSSFVPEHYQHSTETFTLFEKQTSGLDSNTQPNLEEQQPQFISSSECFEMTDKNSAGKENSSSNDKDHSLSDKRKGNVHFNDKVHLIVEDNKIKAFDKEEEKMDSELSEINISAGSVEENLEDW